MPVRSQISDNDGLYFITITCARWLHLFEISNGYDVVYRWFDYLKREGHFVTGYVIMPNHIHALIGFRNTGKSINSLVGNGKRFMAYEIVQKLRSLGREDVLKKLNSFVNETDRKRNKLHEVFEPSFDWKECIDPSFTEQKLEYIHENPCQEHWRLVKIASDYIHSSASFYDEDKHGVYIVTDYAELEDVDLTKSP